MICIGCGKSLDGTNLKDHLCDDCFDHIDLAVDRDGEE